MFNACFAKLNKQANNDDQLDNNFIYDGRSSFWVARTKVTIYLIAIKSIFIYINYYYYTLYIFIQHTYI